MLHEMVSSHFERKRWFRDSSFDLFVWFDPDGKIVAFQLSERRGGRENAVSWDREYGIRAWLVDDGEETPLRNRTPILVATQMFDHSALIQHFRVASEEVDSSIRSFVLTHLHEPAQSS